ncbi:FAD-dependent oxidoreductase [Desulfobotulus mexicanus]|uniref:Pyridine nucleotide-disulfide oxidoreductase n=1 Tax=Desulfobotulus mexicanus TaxID=2586642 RepID=A0A5Q4VE37_9BACT|nr:FAD-dependent oxidoreductase [Desulfobotulus mexicanus]TYT75208.1 pyridine nucleotide-disulfide oxidoreductase [Desulfobotulus mexicanus]
MHFVIIGGDAAGMSAASRARRNAPDMKITVLEMTQDISYSACSMPYVLADEEGDMDALIIRAPAVFREKHGIDLRLGHKVEDIDPEARRVSGRDSEGRNFEVFFDKLLIATGSAANMPLIPGHNLPHVFVLKSLDDGRRVQAYIAEKKIKKAAIIGAGYIGLEMCEALTERGITVQLIRNAPEMLPWLAPELSLVVEKALGEKGVLINNGCTTERIEAHGSRLDICCKEACFDAEMVLMAIGVRPSSLLAKNAGLELGAAGAIAVNRSLQTSHPDIYAAGDCADAYHVVTGEKAWIPMALTANRAGWAVADHITGKPVRMEGVAGTGVFKIFDVEVARTGLTVQDAEKAGFDPVEVVVKSYSRAKTVAGSMPVWVQMVGDRQSGRLLGVSMVGKDNEARRINAAAVALHARMRVVDFSTADLAYAPPFSPVWDPLLVAANQLLKKL